MDRRGYANGDRAVGVPAPGALPAYLIVVKQLTCNQALYAALPPGQILPDLADQEIFVGSEGNFYRVVHEHYQVHVVAAQRHHRSTDGLHGCVLRARNR